MSPPLREPRVVPQDSGPQPVAPLAAGGRPRPQQRQGRPPAGVLPGLAGAENDGRKICRRFCRPVLWMPLQAGDSLFNENFYEISSSAQQV